MASLRKWPSEGLGLQVFWPSSTFCDSALAAFSQLHLSHNLGLLDALIAFTAVELNEPLRTFNKKHYAAIATLKTVQLLSSKLFDQCKAKLIGGQ